MHRTKLSLPATVIPPLHLTLCDSGCVHNQKSDRSDQIQISLGASEKNPTLPIDFYKPCPRGIQHKRSNSQFQMANHRDWSIMGYNDTLVCITVINLTNAFFFIRLDRSRLINLDRSDFWLWMQPLLARLRITTKLCKHSDALCMVTRTHHKCADKRTTSSKSAFLTTAYEKISSLNRTERKQLSKQY